VLFPVCLDEPPVLVQFGPARHGTHGVLEEDWCLPRLWAVHFYRYQGELTVDGRTVSIRPGQVSVVPPGGRMRYRYRGPSEHIYAHVRMDRPPGAFARQRLQLMDDLRGDGGAVRAGWERLLDAPPDATSRSRAVMWELLWMLADRAAGAAAAAGPTAGPTAGARPGPSGIPRTATVATAIKWIDEGLSGRLRVAELAEWLGVSHNHLTRLFRSELDCTVVEFVRRRRLERARHLLANSTLPVKSIAVQVGIPDLQAFNKSCHREFGAAPRELRAAGERREP
jgi:AraC-like DNA-binding protein